MRRSVIAAAATVAAIVTSCSSGSQPTGRPAATTALPSGPAYPSPVAAADGALSACPSPVGLRPFTPAATKAARATALSYDRRSLRDTLARTDPSWWPSARRMWASRGTSPQEPRVVRVTRAAESGYRVVVARSCGSELARRSLAVVVGPPRVRNQPHCNACNSTFFLVNRLGRPLVYLVW